MSTKPTWADIVAWAKSEITRAQLANDAAGLPPTETEALRARIAVLRELQALTETPAAPELPPSISYT